MVSLARYGPILSQDGATDSRKVSKYLPGLREAMQNQKWLQKLTKKQHKQYNYPLFSVHFDIYLFGVSRWDHLPNCWHVV